MVIGMIMALTTPVPDMLVDANGKLVGVLSDDGKFLVSSKRRGKFQRELWMSALGIDDYGLMECDKHSCKTTAKDQPIFIVMEESDDLAPEGFIEVNLIREECGKSSKFCISKKDLNAGGSHAVYLNSDGIKLVPSMVGQRPWNLVISN